jgi:hypothetical protein
MGAVTEGKCPSRLKEKSGVIRLAGPDGMGEPPLRASHAQRGLSSGGGASQSFFPVRFWLSFRRASTSSSLVMSDRPSTPSSCACS